MSNLALRVDDIGKQYNIFKENIRYSTLRDKLVNTLKSPVKTLRRIDIHYRPAGQAPMRDGQMECGYWRFAFEANAFLHHMIRNIMGCLIYVGQGSKPVEWMQQVLEARSR